MAATSLVAIGLLSLLAPPAGAQGIDPRFLPWVGCWVPIGALGEGTAVCFRPAPAGEGLELISVTDGQVSGREVVLGEGEERETLREDCEGWEAIQLSPDGRRMYTRSTHTCADDVSRSATGVMSFVSPTQWVDIRSVFVGMEPVASVQYYQLASPEAVAELELTNLAESTQRAAATARRLASLPPTVEQVIEVSTHVQAKAVEAWIVETGQPFRMSGSDLVAMDDAGVPGPAIDAMIAVSFPRKFAIDRAGQAQLGYAGADAGYGGVGGGGAYRSFYFGRGYAYTAGYGYPGYGYWYRGYRPIYVVVTPRPPRTAEVVNGRGYTHGRGNGGSLQRGDAGSGSGGGSYKAPSGSGPRSTGRTAKPRRR